jgi:hypothetical protein
MSYYEIKVVEGELLKDHDKDVMINESAAKAFGWRTSVGKKFNNSYTVKGVVKKYLQHGADRFSKTGLLSIDATNIAHRF